MRKIIAFIFVILIQFLQFQNVLSGGMCKQPCFSNCISNCPAVDAGGECFRGCLGSCC